MNRALLISVTMCVMACGPQDEAVWSTEREGAVASSPSLLTGITEANLLSSGLGFDCNGAVRTACVNSCAGDCFYPCRKLTDPTTCEEECREKISECGKMCDKRIEPKPTASFEARNTNLFIRHQWLLGEVTPISTDTIDARDASFRIVPGLADSSKISFESVNWPGYYLRHEYLRLKLSRFENTSLFRADATFKPVSGLGYLDGISFESHNFPNHFIRHQSWHLWVHLNDGSDQLRSDATFRTASPFSCN